MFACFGFVAFSTFTNDKISLGLKKEPVQCRSKGNIIGGGGGTRAPEARAARGVWGHAPPENFEI